MDERKGIQSIETGFRLLQQFEAASRPLSLSDVAKASGMSPSRARFYLVSMMRVGLVEQAAYGGRYKLGSAALRLGLAALSQLDVLELARAELEGLRDSTGETVFLSVWGERGPIVVNRMDGERIAPLGIRVGSQTPLTHSATGKVFLAYLPRATTRPMAKRELKSSGAGLDRKLDRLTREVREHGMSQNVSGVIPGIAAVAAPVVDYEGALRCVLTVMGRVGRLDIGYRAATSRQLVAAARTISKAAGFTGDLWTAKGERQ